MKKFLLIFFAIAMIMSATSCNMCSKSDGKNGDASGMVLTDTTTVEQVVASDIQAMSDKYADTAYCWFETSITMKNFMDSDNASPELEEVCNTFQTYDIQEKSCDTYVIIYTHNAAECAMNSIHSFVLDDHPLTKSDILLSFNDAYNKMMSSNYKKPHSRKCVLRKESGMKDCDAQYIFGNTEAQLYVNAKTGEVSDKNPAYPAEMKLQKPAWP